MADTGHLELPALTQAHKDWIVDARALGMSYEEIASHFCDVFPDYAEGPPTQEFKKHLESRVKRYLNHSQSSAKIYSDAKRNGEIPVNVEGVPLWHTHVRLMYFQRLWDQTPQRTLVRTVETDDGIEKIYKPNTRERLAILTAFRKEMQELGLLYSPGSANPASASQKTVNVVDSSSLFGEDDEDATQE